MVRQPFDQISRQLKDSIPLYTDFPTKPTNGLSDLLVKINELQLHDWGVLASWLIELLNNVVFQLAGHNRVHVMWP